MCKMGNDFLSTLGGKIYCLLKQTLIASKCAGMNNDFTVIKLASVFHFIIYQHKI